MTYNDWPEDFPPVTSLVPYSALRHNDDPEISDLYDKAKNHEDTIAAAKLINRLCLDERAEPLYEDMANGITIPEKIKLISYRNPNAIIAYVHAIEGQGKNKIPLALAEFIGETSGLEVARSIVQADVVRKTGVTSSWYRMAHRPRFDGQVQSGREYILVDDVFSAGGTFSELRAFIENNGGKVVNAVTMANGSKSINPQLGVTKQHILELEKRYGVESLQQFLKEVSLYAGNHKALTDSEARTILGDSSLDKARDRIFEARHEGIRRNSKTMVQGTSLPDEIENQQNALSDNNSPDNTLSPSNLKNSERQTPAQRGRQNRFDSINDYINRNTTIEPNGSLRASDISVTQANPASLRAEKNNKERSMSDVQENTRDLKEEAFINALYQRKVVTNALKDGTLSCLPGADGIADTSPAVNLVNGTYYHGANMLFLKEIAKEKGFPSAEYVTTNQLDKARQDNPDIMVRKGQHGVSIYFSEQNESGEWEKKNIRLFNIAQTTKPWELKKWAEQEQQKAVQERIEFLKSQYGKNYTPPEQKPRAQNPSAINCTSTDPEKYLGQYLAAVSLGSQFKVTPEQAKEFAQNMEASINEKVGISQKTGNDVTNPFKLSKISNEASAYCKQFMSELKQETRKQNQEQEQHQEHKQEQQRGRSR